MSSSVCPPWLFLLGIFMVHKPLGTKLNNGDQPTSLSCRTTHRHGWKLGGHGIRKIYPILHEIFFLGESSLFYFMAIGNMWLYIVYEKTRNIFHGLFSLKRWHENQLKFSTCHQWDVCDRPSALNGFCCLAMLLYRIKRAKFLKLCLRPFLTPCKWWDVDKKIV